MYFAAMGQPPPAASTWSAEEEATLQQGLAAYRQTRDPGWRAALLTAAAQARNTGRLEVAARIEREVVTIDATPVPPRPVPYEQLLADANQAESIAHVLMSQGQGAQAAQLMANARALRFGAQNQLRSMLPPPAGESSRKRLGKRYQSWEAILRPPFVNVYAAPNGAGIGAFNGGARVRVVDSTERIDPRVAYDLMMRRDTSQPLMVPQVEPYWLRVQGPDVTGRYVDGWIRATDVQSRL